MCPNTPPNNKLLPPFASAKLLKDLPNLPIDEYLDSIQKDINTYQNLIISAAPGTGKTTRIPPHVTQALPGKILVLEPRRLAAISAAEFVSKETSWQLGKEVGYQVRYGNEITDSTKLIFMTEAILIKYLLANPELKGISCIIIDEFHERSASTDLALGLIKEYQELGSHLKLIIMSATLNTTPLYHYLGANRTKVLEVPGKTYDLVITNQKKSQLLRVDHLFLDSLFSTFLEALKHCKESILIFLPGLSEINKCKIHFENQFETKFKSHDFQDVFELHVLHGNLNLKEQSSVIKSRQKRKIIFATNIAESSITVDGVDTVIDSGLEKHMRFNHGSGFSKLSVGRISKSSATQRAGRAARQFKGYCFRMWNAMDELSLPEHSQAEIHSVDLTELIIYLAALGVTNFHSFSWFESPAKFAIDNTVQTLADLNIINKEHSLTEQGLALIQFPLPIRQSLILLNGVRLNQIDLAAKIAAILSERDIFRDYKADSYLSLDWESDLLLRLNLIFDGSDKNNDTSLFQKSYLQLRKIALNFADKNLTTYRNTSSKNQIDTSSATSQENKESHKLKSSDSINELKLTILQLIWPAYSDRLCKRRKIEETKSIKEEKANSKGLMKNGKGVELSKTTLVKKSDFFLALSGTELTGTDSLISMAMGLSKEQVIEFAQTSMVIKSELSFSENKKQFYKKRVKYFGKIPIEVGPDEIPDAEETSELIPNYLCENIQFVCSENNSLQNLVSKIEYLNTFISDESKSRNRLLSSTDKESIFEITNLLNIDTLKKIFTNACYGENNINEIVKKDLNYFFINELTTSAKEFLKNKLPDFYVVPSGSKVRIHYSAHHLPFLEVRIQEIFGLKETPKLLFDLPLQFKLLGPNYRPVQVTSDLKNFWKTSYKEIRKELKARYPKHKWPEEV